MLEKVYHLLEIRKRILSGAEQAMEDHQPPQEDVQLPTPASPVVQPTPVDTPPEVQPKERRWWGDALFYIVLLAIVVAAVVWKGTSAQVRTFAGFSAFTVLSGSMESEIPKGSLIITRQVDPATLQVGDDITYMKDATTTITHRIVEIVEDYQETGQRAFRTQGVMNSEPDKQLVPAVNVVGRVVFHSYWAGRLSSAIAQYWYLVVLFLLLFGGLYAAMRTWVWKDSPEEKKID